MTQRHLFLSSSHGRSFLPSPRSICFRRCLFVYLSICLLATLRKNVLTDLREIFREGWQWLNFGGNPDQGSGYGSRYGYGSGSGFVSRHSLVRRALAEVCILSHASSLNLTVKNDIRIRLFLTKLQIKISWLLFMAHGV